MYQYALYTCEGIYIYKCIKMHGMCEGKTVYFVLNICDKWNIFMVLDCNIVTISLYLLCKRHLHKCFPLVPSSGEQFHLKLLLKCSVLFWVVLAIKHYCNCRTLPRYPYFDAVVGLVWSNDPESCAGGSDAPGMPSLARQVKSGDPDQNGYPGPPGWGWEWGWLSHPVKHI